MTKSEEDKIINRIINDKTFRYELTYKSHEWFFRTYFTHYIDYPFSWIHKEMFALTEDRRLRLAVIMAFRGSGKSTIMNLSYALWSILGEPQKKFVLIISRTKPQARNHFENIKRELESNDLLNNDSGPFKMEKDEQGNNYIELKKVGAKIMMLGATQSIRGLHHGEHRPDLIICDDVEDSLRIQDKKERNRIYNWFMSEVAPLGDSGTKTVVLGNLLHPDSLLMKLKEKIDANVLPGVFKAYPIVDAVGRCLWEERFPDQQAINQLKANIPDEMAWEREYLLKIESGRIFSGEDNFFRQRLDKKEKQEIDKILPNAWGYKIRAPIVENEIKMMETFLRELANEGKNR